MIISVIIENMYQALRTRKTYLRYKKNRENGLYNKGCRLCQIKPIKKFKYWNILPNEYPWDFIAKKHDMAVPIRHTTYYALDKKEKLEYEMKVKTYAEKNYEMLIEASTKNKSIPGHYHVHLVSLQDKYNRE